MKPKQTMFLLFILILLFAQCGTTEPPADELKPGRRDYTWTVDTLNIPFTTLQRIWGSSPIDVWVIGPGGDKDKTIFHFDGVRWNSDGISRPLAPTALYGFSPSDVWIGGRGGEIWHFDGLNWSKVFTMNITGYNFYGFESIWGDAPENVYAVGYAEDGVKYKGILARYDGSTWKSLDIPEVQNSFIKIQRGVKSSANYFILALRFEQFADDTSYIYEFDGIKLRIIYQGLTNTYDLAGLSCIDNEILIRKGYDIFEYKNKIFNFLLRIPGEAFLYGRNIKDIFIGLQNGIAHYNGTDILYLYNFKDSGIRIADGVIFDNEIFVLANDFNSNLNFIYRGVLK